MNDLLKRIAIDPKVMTGKPVIRGTRLTVEHILKELANGMTATELLDAHPRLRGLLRRVQARHARHLPALRAAALAAVLRRVRFSLQQSFRPWS